MEIRSKYERRGSIPRVSNLSHLLTDIESIDFAKTQKKDIILSILFLLSAYVKI